MDRLAWHRVLITQLPRLTILCGMNKDACQDQIDRFLHFREYDLLFRDWPGQNALERIERGHDTLMEDLVSEVRRREDKVPCPTLSLPDDLSSFSRQKLGPMVRGLFPRRECAPVLAVLEKYLSIMPNRDNSPA